MMTKYITLEPLTRDRFSLLERFLDRSILYFHHCKLVFSAQRFGVLLLDFSAANAMVSSGNAMGGSAILGNVVKGAGFLFNNIKDVSSKVVQSVAG